MIHMTTRRRILVEARKEPVCAVMLDAMARTCREQGYDVVRWRGPLSGRMPYCRSLPVCDLAILFNGAHRTYRPVLARLKAWGAATLFVELGWHPQAGHYQVDSHGVNAGASWAREPLETEGNTPLSIRSEGDLLLLLQLDSDTQITEHSPWFRSMDELVRFVSRNSQLPVRVRPHPKAPNLAELRRTAEECGAAWDDSPDLAESLNRSRAVACINSSAAVAALAAKLPVLCYGNALYRHEQAVYCLNDDPADTARVSEELARGESSLIQEQIDALALRIVARQWTVDEVPLHLSNLVAELLAATPRVMPQLTSSDRVERSLAWLADWPAKLLYRKRLKSA
jgi:hypothetical protein